MKLALFENMSQCCGCGTCALVCPAGAIKMMPQELGSLYPKVDTQKCIDCQKCVRSCAYQFDEKVQNLPLKAYAAASSDKKLLRKSASGGVFATLAGAVLDDDGVVFGCSLEIESGKLMPKHIAVQSREELVKLQGSKYVQSWLGDTFLRIKQLLKMGRTVLFSGTPCQVAALKKYTQGIAQGELYTIDLICHGVPSTKLFQDYLAQLDKKPITEFRFRDKTFGWGLTAKYSHANKDGTKKEVFLPPDISSYYSYFLSSEIYRESCYTCRYANLNRVGDITVGDFWGIESEHPFFLEKQGGDLSAREGISAILVNTERGRQLLKRHGLSLQLRETMAESVARWNKQLCGPSRHTVLRQKIVEQYKKEGYAGVEMLFRRRMGIRLYVKQFKHTVKRWLKKMR